MSMSPYERAQLVYQQEACARTFRIDLELHMRHGYVFSTPRAFIMGRAVRHDASYEEITDPAREFKDPTAWLIYLCCGDLRELHKYLPFPLHYLGWERQNILRFYSSARIWSKLKYANVSVREIYPVRKRRWSESAKATIATGTDNGG